MTRTFAASAALVVLCATGRAELIYGLTGAQQGSRLIRFDSAAPETALTLADLTGALPGHIVRGIDFRPATGELYAVSSNGTAGQLYTMNLSTAALTPVGTGFEFGADPGIRVSMDFNPVADRVRLVTGERQNLRVNPDTGALVTEDADLSWSSGDPAAGAETPYIGAIAYSNNTADAIMTTLYAIDFQQDLFATQGGPGGSPVSPNSGLLFSIGTLGLITADAGIGFDISGQTGIGYVSYNQAFIGEQFGTVDFATGRIIRIGAFDRLDVLDIAVAVPAPGAGVLAGIALLAGFRRRAR